MTQRRLTSVTAAILLSVTVLAAIPQAEARPPGTDIVKRVEALALEARRAFNDGKYGHAIQFYLKAYQLEPAGALLYNIAYVYDKKLGELQLAVSFYRRYITATDAEPDVVARATQRIGELKRLIAAGSTGNPVNPRPTVLLDTPTRPAAAPARPVQPVEPRPTPSRPMEPQVMWGWVTLGTGAAVLAGGIGVGFVAQGTHEDFKGTIEQAKKESLQSKGRAQALAADIMMGIGTTAIVTGIVLVATGGRSSDKTSASQLQFGLAPREGGGLFLLGGSL